VSVQAYFALKLTGLDLSGDALSCARRRIRQLGGADAADSVTRFFLALLGQISYGHCDVQPPELVFLRDRTNLLDPALSLVWSHRPVMQVGVERGVRELLLAKPKDWRAATTGEPHSWSTRVFRSFCRRTWLFFERNGWTPLRRRALARCETQLLGRTDRDRISELDFTDLVWHAIALHAVGFTLDRSELRHCEERIREMVFVDDDLETASPRLRDTRQNDTTLSLTPLIESGLSAANPAIANGIQSVLESYKLNANQQTGEVSRLIQLLSNLEFSQTNCERALPPELEIWGDFQFEASDEAELPGDFRERFQEIVRRAIERLRASQNRDGGWGTTLSPFGRAVKSDLIATSNVLEALCGHLPEDHQPMLDRGIAYLRAAQQADGSWCNSDGHQQIECTSQAIRALLAASVTTDDETVAIGINWLVVEQQADGGWREPSREMNDDETHSSPRGKPSALQTARATSALIAAGRANAPATRRGIDCLLESQDEDGGWDDLERSSYDPGSKHWYGSNLDSIAWPLRALSAWAVAARSTESEAAGQLSLRLVDAFAEN
jgi:squalene-hopene/tetraprenyl-beta-curcumene cyclase